MREMSRAQFSKLVKARDEYCRICEVTPGRPVTRTDDPHHIIGRGTGGKNDLENGLGLCRNCHRAVTDGKLKVPEEALTKEQIAYIIEKKYPGYRKIEWRSDEWK